MMGMPQTSELFNIKNTMLKSGNFGGINSDSDLVFLYFNSSKT